MPNFKYTAKTKEDKIVSGNITADLESIAAEIIEEKGLTLVSLEETKEGAGFNFNIPFLNRVGKKELVVFFRQLSVMISAGVTLVESLRILVNQTANKTLQKIIEQIANDVEAGSKFSDAMAKYPKVFNVFETNIVKSGERAGRLNEVLNFLADQEEKDYDILSKLQGAMIYPAVILTGMLGVAIIVMVYVVPNLMSIVSEVGGDLPLSTRILIGTSNFLTHFWWLLLLIVVAAVVLSKMYLNTKSGRYLFDRLKFKIPVYSLLIKRIYLVRMTRSLYTLLVGGVDMVSSLEITAEVLGNEFFKSIVIETAREVKDGSSISKVFLQYKEVPAMVPQMFVVGEKTGSMDKVLLRMGEFYGRELDNYVANLMVLMEPAIMILLGVGVGIMVAAVILPMQSLATRF